MRMPKSEKAQTCFSVVLIVVGLLVFYGLPPVLAQAISNHPLPEREVPTTAPVPGWSWIEVKNPDGIRNGNGQFEFNARCGIAEGGTLKRTRVDGDQVLVSYTSPHGQGYGSECGNNTLFLIHKTLFSSMSSRYQTVLEKRHAEKNEIRRLLK
ncbi:MAG: hypothetical protein Q8P69_02045 [bacterium]|nr:hypothetical protein [bacterium]